VIPATRLDGSSLTCGLFAEDDGSACEETARKKRPGRLARLQRTLVAASIVEEVRGDERVQLGWTKTLKGEGKDEPRTGHGGVECRGR
jgi:transcription elongation GreA/GreB family factor